MDQWMPGELLYDHAVAMTNLAMRTSCLRAIIWHQGESDCLSEEGVAMYGQRFTHMITRLRQDLGAEHVPVILGELPREIGAGWKTQGRETKLNAILHALTQEVPNCVIASSENLTLKADGVHFDSPACREFGLRYFRAYQEICR